MFKNIYLKLYLWFLLIFGVTLFLVALLSTRWYATRVRDEIESYFVSHARYLQDDYLQACGSAGGLASPDCLRFLKRLDHFSQLHFWILDRSGRVLVSHEPSPPTVSTTELERAASGEVVTTLQRRAAPRVVLPVQDSSGKIHEFLILERGFLTGKRFPRFPLVLSLLVAGIIIAFLVLPLSVRLTRPIRELHRLAQEWAEGHLEKRATVSGNDEISDLAKVFNAMAGNLHKMMQQRKEFLAFISHELKSPLTRMRIALELLSEKNQPDSKLIQGIEAEITESEKLIEQLLLLSRIEMSLPSADLGPLDLTAVINKALEQVDPMARVAGIRMETVGLESTANGRIRGDPILLQRAIANVLENAVKFSPKGGLIRLSLSRPNGKVLMQVADQGSGITLEESGKIFEPFYRGQNTEKKEGSGLGLFLARRIIEIHRGTISAHPNNPAGTVISIELPCDSL